jgi:hypothetical protein
MKRGISKEEEEEEEEAVMYNTLFAIYTVGSVQNENSHRNKKYSYSNAHW